MYKVLHTHIPFIKYKKKVSTKKRKEKLPSNWQLFIHLHTTGSLESKWWLVPYRGPGVKRVKPNNRHSYFRKKVLIIKSFSVSRNCFANTCTHAAHTAGPHSRPTGRSHPRSIDQARPSQQKKKCFFSHRRVLWRVCSARPLAPSIKTQGILFCFLRVHRQRAAETASKPLTHNNWVPFCRAGHVCWWGLLSAKRE